MVLPTMGCRWNSYGIQSSCFFLLIVVLQFQEGSSLNSEGLALLQFRSRVEYDPYGAFGNWDASDKDPCLWSGVRCVDGKVETLVLNGFSLGGTLAPDIGQLSYLRSLALRDNHLFGPIPEEIGGLTMLEVLDLRNNKLSGNIPAEIGRLLSLKHLLICNNNFDGELPLELGKLKMLSELQFDENLTSALSAGIDCVNRKFGVCIWQSNLKQRKKGDTFMTPIKGTLARYLNLFPRFSFGKDFLQSASAHACCDNLPADEHELHIAQNVETLVNTARRRLLEQSGNLAATPPTGGSPNMQITTEPFSRSSGSFPAVPNAKKEPVPSDVSPPAQNPNTSPTQNPNTSPTEEGSNSANQPTDHKPSSGGLSWIYILLICLGALVLSFAAAMVFVCRSRAVTTIGPWKTGLSGQLQKAFITGVPKLNRGELETACEDFSNIIDTIDGCTIYKGTLSSGVEIAVTSTAITSSKEWSKRSELAYRKKIDTLSRINHKNFVNLIGYCEEDEPFARMMVFEYAPNGTLYEHLHVKELEHLDWNARTRIIMGTAYCLQYMHELNPPVAHANLSSNSIYLTDDYAAKIAEVTFWSEATSKPKSPEENESENAELPPFSDPETNVHCFGLMLLEIVTGRPLNSEDGPLADWAAQYLLDERSFEKMVDPFLKSFKDNELNIICEVIKECLQPDGRKRPTMTEIISRLREVIAISPEAATPRLSPLWWAELEILSSEAA